MADVIRKDESINRLNGRQISESESLSNEQNTLSEVENSSETPLDPIIARRVKASIKKNQEALDYLKNN